MSIKPTETALQNAARQGDIYNLFWKFRLRHPLKGSMITYLMPSFYNLKNRGKQQEPHIILVQNYITFFKCGK